MKKNKVFSSNDITIHNDDCLNVLKSMASGSVDLIVTSPPYCMQKEYENLNDDINKFEKDNKRVIKESIRLLKPGGSLCWQTGYHVEKGCIIPLDVIIYNIVSELNSFLMDNEKMVLRNRIVWTFGHGLHSEKRFSGRHETILWFTKGEEKTFNLDCVRVPQKYPGKTYFKGKHKGEFSGNPKGKNPSDVWDIPNVKFNHIEKTNHPCQFPEALVQRLVLSLTNPGELVLDPYSGSGTTALACYLNGRSFVGAELNEEYFNISVNRLTDAFNGNAKIREDIPVSEPNLNSKVAKKPDFFM